MKWTVLSLVALSLLLLAPASSAADPVYRADVDTIPAAGFPTTAVEFDSPLIPIYDNIGAAPVYFYRGQAGEEAIDDLHGIRAGVLTRVEFQYYEPEETPFSATIRIYGNPGGNDEAAPLIGGPYVVEGLAPGVHTAEFELPGGPIIGPDLWVGVRFSSPTAGLALNDDPVTGTSHDYFLENGTLYFFGGRPKANFGIRVSVRIPVTPTGDLYEIDEDDSLLVVAPGVLGNDGEDLGVGLTAVGDTDVGHGILTLQADGSFIYTPEPDYHGPDEFTYTAVREADLSGAATVRIVVNPINDNPVAYSDTFSVAEDGSLDGDVLANDEDIDGDELQAELIEPPLHGSLALDPGGTFTYTPDENFHGEDSFRYTAGDAEVSSNEALVTITIEAVNDPPAAVDDTTSTRAGVPVTFDVLANDFDVDGDGFSVIEVSQGAHGTAALADTANIIYTVALGFVGRDTLTYSVADPWGAADTALVVVQVVFGGPAPTVVDGPHEFDGHEYYLLSFAPWEDSEAAAVALGGHLATIDSLLEQEWVYETFTGGGAVDRTLWIGLNDREVEGSFAWVSGEPEGYTNWRAGQPDQCAGLPENYAGLLPPSDPAAAQWVDLMNEGGGGCGGQWYPFGVVEIPVVIDPTPIITVPAEVTAEATGPDGAVVLFEVTAESPRCGPVPVICTPPSSSIFPLGETTVLCEAECEGAVATATLIVRVVDTTPPDLVCPAPIIVECTEMGGTPASDPQLVDFFAGALATDLVDPAPEVTYQAPGAFGLGETMVRFTATDFSGNASTCLTRVTVVDTTPPAIAVTLNRYILWPANHRLADIIASVSVSDTCDANPTFTLASITSDEPENGTGDGDTAPDIVGAELGTSDLYLQLRSERAAQGSGRNYTLTYAATDACGNEALASVLVRVPRNRAGGAASSHGFQQDGAGVDSLETTFALVVYSTPVNEEEGFVDLVEINVVNDVSQMVETEQKKPGLDAGLVDPRYAYVGNTEGVLVPESSFLQDLNNDGLKDLALLYSAAELRELIRESSADAGPIGLHYTTDDGVDYAVANIFALGSPIPFGAGVDTPDRGGDRRPGWVRPQDAAGADPGTFGAEAPPAITALTAAYPNPFSGTVTAAFDLSRGQTVRLVVYDVRGTLVRTLVREERLAGRYQESWDGRSDAGSRLPAGLYFVRFDAGDVRQTHKVILMR